MVLQLLFTLLAWSVLVVVSVNLLGMAVRTIVDVPGTPTPPPLGAERDGKRSRAIAGILLILFLLALGYFLGLLFVLAALLLMASRVPDLLWEIRQGKTQMAARPPLYQLTLIPFWVSLPLVWLAFDRT